MASAKTTRAEARPRLPWLGGWHPRARALPSPNEGPRPEGVDVTLVVVHSISLPPGRFGGEGVPQLFTNRLPWEAHPYYASLRGLKVSAHFFIRRDGRLLQFVSCDRRAWHAGVSNWRGRENCNDWSVGVELEGLEGGAFTSRQYARLARLILDLGQRYPLTEVVGHEHVAPGRKRDPGAGFEWSRLRRGLGAARLWLPDLPGGPGWARTT